MTVDEIKALLPGGFLNGVARLMDFENALGVDQNALLKLCGDDGIRSDMESMAEDAQIAFSEWECEIEAK